MPYTSLPSVFTTVTETTQNYTCVEELHHVQSEYAMKSPDCDQYWSAQDHVSRLKNWSSVIDSIYAAAHWLLCFFILQSIATFLQSTPECHSPCKEVFVGRIVLTDCVNITLAVICTRVSRFLCTTDHVLYEHLNWPLTSICIYFKGLFDWIPCTFLW